jgi:hypothetical protein
MPSVGNVSPVEGITNQDSQNHPKFPNLGALMRSESDVTDIVVWFTCIKGRIVQVGDNHLSVIEWCRLPLPCRIFGFSRLFRDPVKLSRLANDSLLLIAEWHNTVVFQPHKPQGQPRYTKYSPSTVNTYNYGPLSTGGFCMAKRPC